MKDKQCEVCKVVIFNRLPHAKYCLDCYKIVRDDWKREYSRNYMRYKYRRLKEEQTK